MKISKSDTFNEEYAASCVRIGEIYPIEGKDRIVKTNVNGMSIVIGKDEFKPGDVAVYCANETVIHELFLHLNSMFDEPALNADTTRRGYINKYGRLRVIRLGGVPSYGLLLNPKTISVFLNEPEEEVKIYLENHIGEHFDEMNGEKFIQVYMPPVKGPARTQPKTDKIQNRLKRFKMLIQGSFRFHYKTEKLGDHINEISPDDEVWISVKLDGTSVCMANILTNMPTPWYKRFWRRLFGKMEYEQKYNLVYSSRKVIKNAYINPEQDPGGFYSDDVWGYWAKKLEGLIPKDVGIYGEIVGYTPNGTHIQKGYDYKCNPNVEEKSKLMIYRMTKDNNELEISDVIEFGEYLKSKLGDIIMEYPLLYHGTLKDLYPELSITEHWHENVLENLKNEKRFCMEEDEPLCNNKVPREGFVLRKANDPIAEAWKVKTDKYWFRQRDQIDKGEVDMETLEGYGE